MVEPHHPPSVPTAALLECRAVSKSFGPVEVLRNISITMTAGEVHAIIGENGAGKSTLMKILGGHHPPTTGALLLDGSEIRFAGPADAERHGIVLVHQEILLAPDLTVAQNIFIGRELRRGLMVNDREMNRIAAAAMRRLGAEIDPTIPVMRLSIAQRQLVQIARALQVPHRVVIFDEPTASLTPVETIALLAVIRRLRADGAAVLYISHRLPEVAEIADQITVLRDGNHVGTYPASSLTPLDMARLMVGRDMSQLYPALPALPGGEPLLEVEDLSTAGYARNVSFTLRPGEILGFAGLIGAGRTETMEALTGLRPHRGTIRHKGRDVRFNSAHDSMTAGIVYLTEDRKGKGLLLDKDLRMNLTLATLPRFSTAGMIDSRREYVALTTAISDFDIRTRRRDLLAGQLSGGNQQKLLLAKMMLLEPEVIIIDEPTRGIDIGTKQQIYEFIATLARQGKGVIVISSEMQELIGTCHRIIVMRSGEVAGEVTGDEMTEDAIVVHATGANAASARGAANA